MVLNTLNTLPPVSGPISFLPKWNEVLLATPVDELEPTLLGRQVAALAGADELDNLRVVDDQVFALHPE